MKGNEELPDARNERSTAQLHYGDIARRDLTLEEITPRELSPPPSRLRDCLKKDVLDMAAATLIMHESKCRKQFSEGSYEEFVRYVATHQLKKFCFKNFKNILDYDEYRVIHPEALQLMADIIVAESATWKRRLVTSIQSPRSQPSSRAKLCITNCTRTWILDSEEPFAKVDLVAITLLWNPKRGEDCYAQSLSLFRYLLKRITGPTHKNREFAVRVNGGNGRDANLKNLPEDVESTLLDFVEDMLGYGRDELKSGENFERSTSRFYMSLGKTEEEREEAFENLVFERVLWRKHLLKSLQKALSDVRCRPHLV